MSDGTEQSQRVPAAWADGGFKVDEMALDRLVEACARVGERLRFVDLNGHEQGSWEHWFDNDETLVLARIASIDRYGRQQDFLSKAGSAPLAELAFHVLELAQLLDRWLQALSGRAQPAAAVHEVIQQLIDRPLAGELRWLAERVSAASWGGRSLHAMYLGLQPQWHNPREETLPPPDTLRRERLRGMFFTFLTAVTQVRTLAREHWPRTLPSGQHEPAAGLLLTFLDLYGSVQQQINRFTDRHIDFYYRRCLGLQPRALQLDRVSVACRLDPLAPPALDLPARTAFVAGKDIAGQPLLFRSLEDVSLSDARVASLCTLRLERDPRIKPEADLHYVTGIKAHRLGLPASDAAAVPAFGGGPGSQEATLGLAVATPMLLLKEGSREIELNLRLSWPAAVRKTARSRTVAPGLKVRASEQARQGLQDALFGRWLLSDDADALADDDRQALEQALELARGPRDRAFFDYASSMFEVALTHARGWFVAERVQVARTPRGSSGSGGLQLRIHLRPEDPAIVGCDAQVHGAQWPTRLPLLRLQVNPRAPIHPYSLLEGARLVEAEMRVRVRGAKDVLLHNNLGPLDPTKTFNPFGPLPTTSSYLVFGSPEASRKNLDSLALRVEWGGLPEVPGGFAAHYGGYGPQQRAGRFTAALSILRDGQWQPCGGQSAAQPLFADPDAQGRLPSRQRFEVDGESVRQHAWASDVPLTAIGPGVRNGLVRLQLNHPQGAFGHADYPSLLADALSARARRRRAGSLPNAPHTPVIEALSLDYSAGVRIRPDAERRSGAATDGARLMHIHPFGVAELQPDVQTPHHGVLPALGPDGSLYIGLRASRLEGPLSLLLQLRETDAAGPDALSSRAALQWSCLEANHWRPLPPHCVLADGTQGMLTSGVVRLDLPALGTRTNTVMEEGLYWLRVARDRPEAAARLVTVHAQALTLEREVGAAGAADAPLPPQRITQAEVPQAGLAGVLQPEPSRGWRPAEDERQFRVRAGERLRHKNRASLAWDVERLVLEAFPEVFKVKCLSAPESGLGSGSLRVVVVPRVHVTVPEDSLRAPRFDASHLMRVQDFLAERCSPFARLVVCNAAYERLQVRCRVRLERGEQAGSLLRRINQALVEFLSPWHDVGHGARFGWLLRCDEIQAVVRAVPGVASVGGVSLLHLVEASPGHFVLHDTARTGSTGKDAAASAVPWSLALPMAEHLLRVVPNDVAMRPQATGVLLLSVGSTFVVS